MREILFRGKRMDNGEWVCGDLVHSWEKMNAKPDIQIHNNMGYFDVIPETVGECTSLTDKNGKRIFEGDIVDILTENEEIGIVAYDDGGFLVNPDSGFFVNADAFYVDFHSNINGTDLEIIGNIHDNPELLKGAD